jgi:hypothetical protein
MTTNSELQTKAAELDSRRGCTCKPCTCKNCGC